MDGIEARIREIIVDQIGCQEKEVTPEASFEEFGADSLDVVEIIMAIEEKWSLEIPDNDAEGIHNLKEAVAYVESRLEQGSLCS